MAQLGYAAIMYAVEKGFSGLEGLLVEAGAKLNVRNWVGGPLMSGSITELSFKDNRDAIGTITSTSPENNDVTRPSHINGYCF